MLQTVHELALVHLQPLAPGLERLRSIMRRTVMRDEVQLPRAAHEPFRHPADIDIRLCTLGRHASPEFPRRQLHFARYIPGRLANDLITRAAAGRLVQEPAAGIDQLPILVRAAEPAARIPDPLAF